MAKPEEAEHWERKSIKEAREKVSEIAEKERKKKKIYIYAERCERNVSERYNDGRVLPSSMCAYMRVRTQTHAHTC